MERKTSTVRRTAILLAFAPPPPVLRHSNGKDRPHATQDSAPHGVAGHVRLRAR
jgi:hypothetical protein